MKKIFTLIVALMAMVSTVNAEETVLFEGSSELNWYPALSIDCSSLPASGLTLHVTFEVTKNSWWQFKLTKSDWSGYVPLLGTNEFVNPGSSGLSMNPGTYTLDVELTDEQLAAMKPGVIIQGSDGIIKKVTVTSKINYQSPVAISLNQKNQVESKTFNSYSNDAKITLTYVVTGAEKYMGWGNGMIKSLNGAVEYGTYAIKVKKEGEHVLTFTLADVLPLLNAAPNNDGQYGMQITVWPFGEGACTTTIKSLTIQEVEGFSGKGYRSPDTPMTTEEVEIHNAYNFFLQVATIWNRGAEYEADAKVALASYEAGAITAQKAMDNFGDALFKALSDIPAAAGIAKAAIAQFKAGDVATGINNVAETAPRAGKFMQNGRIVIVKNGKTYSTTGALLK